MILGIDIDDTLTNSKDEIVKAWNEYYNLYDLSSYTSHVPDNINTGWDDKYISQFWDLYRTKIAASALAKDNASDALYKLKNNGHIIKIVTSRPENQRLVSMVSLKRQKLIYDQLILNARHKGQVCKEYGIDLMIDDTQMNLDDVSKCGIRTYLFEETDNWNNVYKKILQIARNK